MAKNKDSVLQAQDPVMYVGPHRMDPIPLARGNVFTELPKLLAEAIKADTELAAQFVPVKQAGTVLRQSEGDTTNG